MDKPFNLPNQIVTTQNSSTDQPERFRWKPFLSHFLSHFFPLSSCLICRHLCRFRYSLLAYSENELLPVFRSALRFFTFPPRSFLPSSQRRLVEPIQCGQYINICVPALPMATFAVDGGDFDGNRCRRVVRHNIKSHKIN